MTVIVISNMTSKEALFSDEKRLLLPNICNEHPLDEAMRTQNLALRCFFVENGYSKTQALFHTLDKQEQQTFNRIPLIEHDTYENNTFLVQLYDGGWQVISEREANTHKMFAFCVKND